MHIKMETTMTNEKWNKKNYFKWNTSDSSNDLKQLKLEVKICLDKFVRSVGSLWVFVMVCVAGLESVWVQLSMHNLESLDTLDRRH